ncbi:hypothetical protein KY343_07240 [Candidatus Woesearchaeota archaeon]|nr:hypothetical protein [Candidatus Woesearchaeota archaeon]
MAHYLVEQGFIPLDKSWINRMVLLDFINGSGYAVRFLTEHYDELGDDLKSTYRAYTELKQGKKEIHVGESGTLYRFLKFLFYKQRLNLELIPEGTLIERVKNFCDDPDMINWSLEKLLNTKDRTTQWASAAILLGNNEIIQNSEPKIRLSYEAREHWYKRRRQKKYWEEQHDLTILAQAMCYLSLLKEEGTRYTPGHAEDYCFARAFGFITKGEGEIKYPNLRGHESDRIIEMEKQLGNLKSRRLIDSNDHRVVQAISMYYVVNNKAKIKDALSKGMNVEEAIRRIQGKFSNPCCVSKSWPQFWKFLEYSIRIFQK